MDVVSSLLILSYYLAYGNIPRCFNYTFILTIEKVYTPCLRHSGVTSLLNDP